MKLLISPTKQMNFENPLPESLQVLAREYGETPLFAESAELLISLLKQYSRDELMTLMKISPSLAETSYHSIHNFKDKGTLGKPALYTYSGTVFQFLESESFSPDDLIFAQEHLRILSGLYGLLKPLDKIKPYRLEMKTPLKVPGSGATLGSFWKDPLSRALAGEEQILNLASDEYSRVIDRKKIRGRIITILFKEEKKGVFRTVGMYAKRARGVMVRRIIDKKITDPEALKTENIDNYRYRNDPSRDNEWLFVR